MPVQRKYDDETRARAVRLYVERRKSDPAESQVASRRHVGGLIGVGIGFGQGVDLAAHEVRNLLLPEPVKPESDREVPDFELVHRELARHPATLLRL